MTARGIRLALALALVVSLGVAASADASTRLTRKEARRMAAKLGRKQIRKFDLRFYELGRPRRTGPRSIVFAYAARTRANTYCTATLRVRKRVRGTRILLIARIGHQRCRRMPDDAVAVETATRKAIRAVRRRATARSLDRLFGSFRACERLHVPRSRERAVEAIFDSAFAHALYDPNRRAIAKYVDRLDLVDTTHVALGDAVAGWLDFADAVRGYPSFRHPCATIKRWKRHGWSSDASPVDVRAVNRLDQRISDDDIAVLRGARFLAHVGAYPRVVARFDVFDLVLSIDDLVEVDTIQAPIRFVHGHVRLK